jgi:hypothetical protein
MRGRGVIFRRGAPPRAEGERPGGERRRAGSQRAGRQSLGRAGRLVITEETHLFAFHTAPETECIVRELSLYEAGVELTGRELAIGDHVFLDLRLGERPKPSIVLSGEVRHSCFDDGVVRADIEFVDVGAIENALLVRLLEQERDGAGRR